MRDKEIYLCYTVAMRAIGNRLAIWPTVNSSVAIE